jgi:hypothetical protein
MHVYGTASNPQLEYCFDSTQPVKIIVLALQYHDTSPRYSASCTAFNSFQHHYLQPNMVYTSTYKYIQCTDAVRTGMYFVHNHTSLPIKANQPCDAGGSPLRAGSAHAEQHPSGQQSPRLTDHPGMYPSQHGMSAAQTLTYRYVNKEYVTNMSVPVCTWYKHVYAGQNVYIHVYTFMYTYEQCAYLFILAYVCTMYVHVSYLYVQYQNCTYMYIHFRKCMYMYEGST